MRALRLLPVVALIAGSLSASALADTAAARRQDQDPPGSFELVGHNPLMNRGMNAALAVKGNYAYVGSRTDGKENNANNAGVFVVDVKDPSKPEIVHQIGPPNEGNEGETSREMRIWRSKNLLIVMNLFSNCSELIHACQPVPGDDNFRFYDISGDKAKKPKLVHEYIPSQNPHEFYLWEDPKDPRRALLFISTPGGSSQWLVADISKVPSGGKVRELGTGSFGAEDTLHSLSLDPAGKFAYIAHLTGGFLMADPTEFTRGGVRKPQLKPLTRNEDAANWREPGPHSAVPLFGSKHVLTTDESYGEALRALGGHGCPWGWSRIVDVSNVAKPKVVAEYKLLPYNEESYCTTSQPRPNSSYSSHNPTLTKNLAFISWHSGGLQAVDISNPLKPTQAAEFYPAPLPVVLQEDPALSAGEDKVVVWSYPIIQDGLIYVVDIRNGLYFLRYKGPFESEVKRVTFLEGNSNLVDALKIAGIASGGGGGNDRGCTIIGRMTRDVLRGTDGTDVICGRAGNDVITGARGNDVIRGNRGDDRIDGGAGRDRIFGGRGRDTCIGGPGRDRLRGCR